VTIVRVSACIVGGGPAGLMLGLLLAQRDVDGATVTKLDAAVNEFRG